MLAVENWRLTNDRLGASTGQKASNPAIQQGIRYHQKVYKTLRLHCALNYPDAMLLVEPWFKSTSGRLRSPDALLLWRDEEGQPTGALVIEVKLNWKTDRDRKLMDEYVPLVKRAFNISDVTPLLIVGNLRGKCGRAWTSTGDMLQARNWQVGDDTPTLLVLP